MNLRPVGTPDLEALSGEITVAWCGGVESITIDLAAVDHLDLVGLRWLAACRRVVSESGGELQLVGLTPYLRSIILASGMGDRLGVA